MDRSYADCLAVGWGGAGPGGALLSNRTRDFPRARAAHVCRGVLYHVAVTHPDSSSPALRDESGVSVVCGGERPDSPRLGSARLGLGAIDSARQGL